MSWEIPTKVTEAAGGVMSGVSSSMDAGIGLLSNVSSGLGETVHSLGCSMKRLITSPPSPENEEVVNSEIDCLIKTPEKNAVLEGHLSPSSDSSPYPKCANRKQSEAIDTELGLTEDLAIQSEVYDIQGDAGMAEISGAIFKCKELILASDESTERRRTLVHKLIQLRLCLEQAKEDEESAAIGIKVRKDHKLYAVLRRAYYSRKHHCDQCSQIIWGVVHIMYKCSLCSFQCHKKCLKNIRRTCASAEYKERPNYNFRICPEIGLSAQDFRCAECKIFLIRAHSKSLACVGDPFSKDNPWMEPRLCNYSGRYFCSSCHWNNMAVIPARVVLNWDFDCYPVSQKYLQLLNFMRTKPLIYLEELNPNLAFFIDDLSTVRKNREDLIKMKAYLLTCRVAQEQRLVKIDDCYQHLLEEPNSYSMQDLEDLSNGVMSPYLQNLRSEFAHHIKETCQACQGKGFICEGCQGADIIFPFDEDVVACEACKAVFHSGCFDVVSCPKCVRHQNRAPKNVDFLQAI